MTNFWITKEFQKELLINLYFCTKQPVMSLSTQLLTKVYGTQKALDEVTLTIEPGEIVGLLGPNGAGKSTMMKILTCFIRPSSGTASVCGYDVMTDADAIRSRIGYLPENNPLYTELYVREFLEYIAGIYRLGKTSGKKVKEMIDLTGLGPEKHKKIGALSKGYRQRVGLAQALIHDPDVLIMDEPTSGLDPNQIIEIRNLIKETGKKKTVLLSTHIMQEVEAVCHRVIIIHKGKVVADEKTTDLPKLLTGKEIIRVEFNQSVKVNLLAGIPGVMEISHLTGHTYHITATGKKDIREDIFRFAVQHNLAVISMNRETQRMEEVFQELTRE